MQTECSKKKILIVEDEQFMLEALSARLNAEGFTIFEARNGKEGLVMALREQPDLVLLDILMPRMDGLSMLKKLRRCNDWGRNVLVILLTNLNSNEKLAEAVAGGMHDYLIKSDWRLEDIVKKIKQRLGLARYY